MIFEHFDHLIFNQSEYGTTVYIGACFRIWVHFVTMQLKVIVTQNFVSDPVGACVVKSKRKFFLNQEAWHKLQGLRSVLEQNEEGHFSLKGGEYQLNEKLSVHIPEAGNQFELCSGEQSILLNIQEYKYLVSHADIPKEELLGLYVFREMLEAGLDKIMKSLIHKKVLDAEDVLGSLFDVFFDTAIPHARTFIKQLAEEAYGNSYIIQSPFETYKLVMEKHLPSMKKELTPGVRANVAKFSSNSGQP